MPRSVKWNEHSKETTWDDALFWQCPSTTTCASIELITCWVKQSWTGFSKTQEQVFNPTGRICIKLGKLIQIEVYLNMIYLRPMTDSCHDIYDFLFPGYGRWRSEARSCNLYKLWTKETNWTQWFKLYSDKLWQWKHGKQDQKPKQTQDDPQIPQPDLRFATQTTAKQQQNGARAQTRTNKHQLPPDREGKLPLQYAISKTCTQTQNELRTSSNRRGLHWKMMKRWNSLYIRKFILSESSQVCFF